MQKLRGLAIIATVFLQWFATPIQVQAFFYPPTPDGVYVGYTYYYDLGIPKEIYAPLFADLTNVYDYRVGQEVHRGYLARANLSMGTLGVRTDSYPFDEVESAAIIWKRYRINGPSIGGTTTLDVNLVLDGYLSLKVDEAGTYQVGNRSYSGVSVIVSAVDTSFYGLGQKSFGSFDAQLGYNYYAPEEGIEFSINNILTETCYSGEKVIQFDHIPISFRLEDIPVGETYILFIALGVTTFGAYADADFLNSLSFAWKDGQPNPFVVADGDPAYSISAVPLPSVLLLFGSGLLGLAGWRRFAKD